MMSVLVLSPSGKVLAQADADQFSWRPTDKGFENSKTMTFTVIRGWPTSEGLQIGASSSDGVMRCRGPCSFLDDTVTIAKGHSIQFGPGGFKLEFFPI